MAINKKATAETELYLTVYVGDSESMEVSVEVTATGKLRGKFHGPDSEIENDCGDVEVTKLELSSPLQVSVLDEEITLMEGGATLDHESADLELADVQQSILNEIEAQNM